MNGKVFAFGLLLLCGSVAFAQGPGRPGGFARGRGGFGAERVVTGAPYSAVEVRQFQEQLGNGNLISRTSQTTIYRDSQGRTRTEVTVKSDSGSERTMITISDPVAGERHVLDSSAMTSHTSKMRTAGAKAQAGNRQARPAPSSSTRTGRNGAAITRESLGTDVVNGVSATGTRETEVIPAGRIGNAQAITTVRETWFSADLKRAVRVRTIDPQHGNTDTELTNIAQSEPSSALFVVPAGYTEKSFARGKQ